jgi:hypothetical protein
VNFDEKSTFYCEDIEKETSLEYCEDDCLLISDSCIYNTLEWKLTEKGKAAGSEEKDHE